MGAGKYKNTYSTMWKALKLFVTDENTINIIKSLEEREIDLPTLKRKLRPVKSVKMVVKEEKKLKKDKPVSIKHRSYDERAHYIISKLVDQYEFRPPKNYPEYDYHSYEEDLHQELYLRLWEIRKTNKNLAYLINHIHSTPPGALSMMHSRIYSLLNKWSAPYLLTLKYSCHQQAYNSANDKYAEEIELNVLNLTHKTSENNEIEGVEEGLYQQYVKDVLEAVMSSRSEREQLVLKYRFGLNPDQKCYSLQETGKLLGVTKERIRQIEVYTLRYARAHLNTLMKNPNDIKKLHKKPEKTIKNISTIKRFLCFTSRLSKS